MIVIILISFLVSCGTKNETPEKTVGKLKFYFEHRVNGEALEFDQMLYTNGAGNEYLVNEIQYFLSGLLLISEDGSMVALNSWEDIHYVDTDIPGSLSKTFPDEIPAGRYRALQFTFGLDEEMNQSMLFVNPPESLMFWPELLGGGYHYLKLNGKWRDTLDQVSPFNFHLGIGQIYEHYPDVIREYVHNHFEVSINNLDLVVAPDETSEFRLIMNVENWFRTPNIYDHNFWGGDIMQNQEAMQTACENGWDVFTVEHE